MSHEDVPAPGAVVMVPGPGSIGWFARVEAVRERGGRMEVRVVPAAGVGAAWVRADSVVPISELAPDRADRADRAPGP